MQNLIPVRRAGEAAAAGSVRAALLTPRGRGALAVVGLAGTGACELADRCFRPRGGTPLAARDDGAICVGVWQASPDPSGGAGEELVVVRHAGDHLEVHCHGGQAAAEAVIASLVGSGAVRQGWEAWLRAQGAGTVECEALAAVARVAGPRPAQILIRQAAGLLDQELGRITGLGPGRDRTAAIDRLLRAARVGLRLAEPWRVVLSGPVNAGKSSLVNALAGHARSIVSAEPGTTRDLVTSRLVLGGWEIDLVDTAGLRSADAAASTTERAGIEQALVAAGAADLVLRIEAADVGRTAGGVAGDRELLVVTKADLAAAVWMAPVRAVVTSAVTGQGIAALVDAIVDRLVPEDSIEPGLLDGPVPFTPRQVEVIHRLAEPG